MKLNIIGLILLIGLMFTSCKQKQGLYTKSSGNTGTVGSNAGKNPLDAQCCTDFSIDLCATAGDQTYLPADLLAILVAQGATHNDVLLTPIAATDIIHSIDVDLKGVEGEGQCWDGTAFVTEVATKCDAIYGTNGGQTNLDPGGSRANDGGSKGPTYGGYSLPSLFNFVEVKDGSIATATGQICQDPQLLNLAEKKG